MCWFKLHVCPYPHHEPISSLIFNPENASRWVLCDRPQPWGRLSCGALVVEHPTDLTKSTEALKYEPILATRSNIPDEREQYKHMHFPIRPQRTPSDPVVPLGAHEFRLQGAPCRWCTAVLKLVATKSLEIQKNARLEIALLEQIMDEDQELRRVQMVIKKKEAELDALRHDSWRKMKALLDAMDGKSDTAMTDAALAIHIKLESN